MRIPALLALLAACGGTSGTPTGGGNPVGGGTNDAGTDGGTAVTIEWSFGAGAGSGATTTIDAGTPIRWHNGDTGVVHSVVPLTVPPPSASGNIAPGAVSPSQAIATPGTYQYICGVHGSVMKGTLIVQ